MVLAGVVLTVIVGLVIAFLLINNRDEDRPTRSVGEEQSVVLDQYLNYTMVEIA